MNEATAQPYNAPRAADAGAVITSDEHAHLIAALAACGLVPRPEDEWQADELAMVAEALADLLAVAHWTPATLVAALGGPITLVRDRNAPITTNEAGTRFPVLGLYDADARLLTVNDWSFDPRTGGAAGGRRVLLHELAHAWDRRSRHRLAFGIALLRLRRAQPVRGLGRRGDGRGLRRGPRPRRLRSWPSWRAVAPSPLRPLGLRALPYMTNDE